MMLSLLVALTAGQLLPKDPPVRPRVFRSDGAERLTRLGSDDYAFFEAFPASGAGTSGACSTTAPTGAKGEVLTFSRASTATCTKTASGGLATTGIANGDLVVMSTNQPRVEYDSNGVLGLLVESSRTNTVLRSEELDNVVWSATGTPSAPTVTANFAVGPDGATTAERVQFPATTAVQSNQLQQTITALANPYTCSLYAKGNGTSGTFDISTAGVGNQWAPCSYVSGSWSRCTLSGTAANTVIWFGNQSTNNGGTARGAQDILIWGLSCESGAYATSYIPTTTVAVTRSADAANFSPSLNTVNGFSHAHTFSAVGIASFTGGMGFYQDALNRTQLYQFSTNALEADLFSTSGNRAATSVPGAWAAVTPYRIAMSYSGAGASSTASTYLAGVLQNTSAAGLTSAWTGTQFGFSINSPWNSGHDAIYTRVCLDPSPTRCR
jgi:hypothetical protein